MAIARKPQVDAGPLRTLKPALSLTNQLIIAMFCLCAPDGANELKAAR
jgi:hypothetical protein